MKNGPELSKVGRRNWPVHAWIKEVLLMLCTRAFTGVAVGYVRRISVIISEPVAGRM